MNLDALKGILIVLVVFDHNEFSRALCAGFLYGFGFHVVGFMTIPFLKPAPRLDRRFADYAFRLYYPFFVVASAMALVVLVAHHVPPAEQARAWLHALYSGNADALKRASGMALLWFLPSFLALALLRGAFAGRAATLLLVLACALHPFIGTLAPRLQHWLPLGLLPALYVIPLGWLGVFLQRRLFAPLPPLAALALALALFVPAKLLQMQAHLYNEVGFALVADYTRPLALLLNDLESLTGVLLLFQVCRLPLPALLAACGRVSLQIYLLHAFVALAVYRLVLLLPLPVGAAFALSLSATVGLTLLLARALTHPRAARWLFPRSLAHLLGRTGAPVPLAPAQAEHGR